MLTDETHVGSSSTALSEQWSCIHAISSSSHWIQLVRLLGHLLSEAKSAKRVSQIVAGWNSDR